MVKTPENTGGLVCRCGSDSQDGVDGDKVRQAYFTGNLSVTRVPLRGSRGGREVWCCPDFPTNCIYELITSHKEQLTNEVHRCRMHRHGIRVWIVPFGPQEVRQELGNR